MVFLYRDSYYCYESDNTAECIIARTPYGQTGTVSLQWYPVTGEFTEPEDENLKPTMKIIYDQIKKGEKGSLEDFTAFLSENKIYKTSFSKYGTAYLDILSQSKKGETVKC